MKKVMRFNLKQRARLLWDLSISAQIVTWLFYIVLLTVFYGVFIDELSREELYQLIIEGVINFVPAFMVVVSVLLGAVDL